MTNWFAILVGLIILGAALSKKNVEYFRCWNCNTVMVKDTFTCPYCGAYNSGGIEGGA